MPAVATFLAAKAGLLALKLGANAAVSMFVANTVGFLVTKGVFVVAAAAYSRSQAKKAMRSIGSMDSSRGVSIREPAASRRILYGQMRMGGTIVFADTSGATNEFLHMVIAHCEGPIEEIGAVYLNDEIVPLDGSGNATGKYAGYVTVIKHLGEAAQTVDTALQTAVTSGVWSNNHRLRGVAYSYVRLKHSPDLFPSGLPNFTAILKGRDDIYDPRDASTGYSTNVALCLRHYMLLPKADGGLGASASEIDEDAVIAAANICDEAVNLNPSGTEARYAINGIVDTANEPGDVIEQICGAMAGICPYVGGKFKMKAGAHTASVFSFTEDDMIGRVQFSTRDSLRNAFNGVKGTYITSKNDYQVGDFPPVVNATYTAEDGGARIWKDLILGFTTSSATAQRIAKIELERSRQDIVVNIETKLGAINAHVGDVVDLTLARYGWTNKLFEVTNCAFVVGEGAGGPTLNLRWTLRETASAVWDWNSGEETTVDVAPNTDLPDLFTVAQLSGLTLSNSGLTQSDGTWQPRVLAKWTAATDTYVLNGGRVNLEYKQAVSPTWLIFNGAIRGDAVTEYITDVQTGTSLNARARFENVRFVRGAYSSTASITVAGKTTGPGAPTGITYTAGSAANYGRSPSMFNGIVQRSLRANWTAPAGQDISHFEWAHPATDSTAGADASTKNKVTDAEAIIASSIWSSGYFYVRAIDRTGNAGAWGGGGTNLDTIAGYASGNMVNQNAGAVNITGGDASDVALETESIKIGDTAASSVREITARFDDTLVYTLAGGAVTEAITVALTNRGFSAKPDIGFFSCDSPPASLVAAYHYDHPSNSSTVAWAIVSTHDGTNIGAGGRRFSISLIEFT